MRIAYFVEEEGKWALLPPKPGNFALRITHYPEGHAMNNRKQSTLTMPQGDGQTGTSQGSVIFIGNATVLIRYAGFTILTDPNFIHVHEQVPVGYGLHAPSGRAPGNIGFNPGGV